MKPNTNNKTRKILSFSLGGASLIALFFFLTGAVGGFPVKLNPFLSKLKEKNTSLQKERPEDRIYLQFDKPFYKPGDDVWFSAFVRDGGSMKKSGKSEVLHVELINPKGNVQSTIKLVALNGLTNGDFHIDEAYPGGIYKVRARTKWQENEKDAFVFEKEFQVQKVVLPNLKMKLEFDRKAYGPADQVTASLNLNTNANQALANHEFNYVAQVNGNALAKLKGQTDSEGKASLKFNLPNQLESTDGLVNVMIQFNGLTESISRSIPISLNQVELSFFPEGGDLVENISSQVAFRALNEFGKAADIEGKVLDSKGNTVQNLKSYHFGMGAFKFKPLVGESYSVAITRPAGIEKTYALPEALPRGYVIQVAHNDSKELGLVLQSSENEAVSLVAKVRGEVYWASEVALTGTAREINIPIQDFPMGVCQLTLFDSKGIERCERLAFVNRDRQLQVDIQTDKEKYLPREKVEMTVKVSDERGMPMPANLSLSVVNDQLISFADDKSGNILSKLLLEPDLKQKVEEPAFYFKKEEEKSLRALDYLMMTSGWRRFTWEQILEEPLPGLVHTGEKAKLSGRVLDGYTGQPVPHVSITALSANLGLLSDKNGIFNINNLNLSQNQNLAFTADNYSATEQAVTNYNENLVVYMYPANGAIGGDWGGVELDDLEEDADMMAAPRAQEPVFAEMAVVERKVFAGGRNRVGNKRAKGRLLNKDKAPIMQMAANEPVPAPVDLKLKEKVLEDGIEPREHPDKKEEFPIEDNRHQLENEKPDADLLVASGIVIDDRFKDIQQMDLDGNKNVEAGAKFYRAREFAAPVYSGSSSLNPQGRTDFRSTVYWNPEVKVGRSGKAVLEFYCSDEITSFRTTVEGIGRAGSVGHAEKVFFTQLPFSMSARVPVEVASNDQVVVPVVLTNNTTTEIQGSLHIIPPKGLRALGQTPAVIRIAAGQSRSLFLPYQVGNTVGESPFEIAFASQGHTDAFKQPLKVVPQGFPVNLSFSGTELMSQYNFRLSNVVPGSVTASLTAYPNVVSDLVKGIESILREPYGCFEQTSTSSYPNALVMSYMKETDQVDPVIMKRASDLLDRGYKRLTTYECSQNGYEWFGSNPPHEALSAYGLMQFNDYQKVYDGVDNKMVSRTGKWLMSRRDGKGGFKRDPKALDSFGRASQEVSNAYIVYALSEARFKEIELEAKTAYEEALSSQDPYQLGLVANSMFNLGQQDKGKKALAELMKQQNEDGSFIGKKHSITFSQGKSLKVETTSIAILAMLKGGQPNTVKLKSAVEFLSNSRSGHGGFGSTQATIMALKSLVEYAKFAKQTDEAGVIEVYVNGKKVSEKAYAAGTRDAIEIVGLEVFLGEGKQELEVKFRGCEEALPYAVAVDYHTSIPSSSPECVLDLSTKINRTEIRMGETVRLSAELKNTTNEGQPMTMAIIGLPAGLSAQPWQLKEMQEKKVFDFYEVIGNNVVCYYRQMKPSEVRVINLDLKADIPGRFTAPASAAYLYYTAENKDWTSLPEVKILN